MRWSVVLVNYDGERPATHAANALMTEFEKARNAPEATDAFEIYHERISDSQHAYYLSPHATECVLPRLVGGGYRIRRFDKKPDLSGCRKLPLQKEGTT